MLDLGHFVRNNRVGIGGCNVAEGLPGNRQVVLIGGKTVGELHPLAVTVGMGWTTIDGPLLMLTGWRGMGGYSYRLKTTGRLAMLNVFGRRRVRWATRGL